MAQPPQDPSLVLEVRRSCGLSIPSYCSSTLAAVVRSMGGIYAGQSAARIGCDHLPPNSTLCGGSAVQGQGGGAPMWSVAVLWVCRVCGFLDDSGKGQPQPMFCLEQPCLSYRAI